MVQTLLNLTRRMAIPEPWAEGDNIPWNEPGFSARMLREHLSQDHDAASRRFEIIDRQVEWIHRTVSEGRPAKILDLGCGPGLYSQRLARLGHICRGIDFSPASIQYARQQAADSSLDCEYTLGDLRMTEYGSGYDWAMLVYGEFNVFRPSDAHKILQKAYDALRPGGRLLLEVHHYETMLKEGQAGAQWYSSQGGLFSEQPHLVLDEHFWDEESGVATIRYYAVDAAGAGVTAYAQSLQAYHVDGYRKALTDCGFDSIQVYSGMGIDMEGLFAILAEKSS